MEQEIIKLASQILKKDVQVVERLMGGMSNYTYIIEAEGKKYTFRKPGDKAENFVSRTIERKNIDLVESLGITNHTVYLNLENGLKIAEYVNGTVLSSMPRQPHLEAVAKTLKKIHQSGLKAENDYDHLGRLAKYESYNHTLSPRYVELKNIWLTWFEQYKKLPMVFCHGDAQPSNFIITKYNEALVVDFEFSGNNDPYYDIAQFGNIDFHDALALLDVYCNHQATKEDKKRVIFYRMFLTLQWHQVATFKHEIGLSEKLHIPFDKVAIAYLDKAEALKNMHLEV
ncbi:phosphotransferase family protein [Acholeplasma vituli]|uniref:Phosphotransferase family protein n=1 Tax=Paracholeplasma vituli TaxID=69473 RepID=A0ABT2Q0A7_9MOLU|nr:choline/ethanolamine kinase family protein [Paracholeplasma vituli]MCU0105422.1 phosphotransferase family protein [Paracholeplasma vituli]